MPAVTSHEPHQSTRATARARALGAWPPWAARALRPHHEPHGGTGTALSTPRLPGFPGSHPIELALGHGPLRGSFWGSPPNPRASGAGISLWGGACVRAYPGPNSQSPLAEGLPPGPRADESRCRVPRDPLRTSPLRGSRLFSGQFPGPQIRRGKFRLGFGTVFGSDFGRGWRYRFHAFSALTGATLLPRPLS